MDWGETFRVSLCWAYVEMIKFWAPTPMARGPKMAKVSNDSLTHGDVGTEPTNLAQEHVKS